MINLNLQQSFIIIIIWQNPQAGKIRQILSTDWLPVWARWLLVPTWDFPCWSSKKKFSFCPHNKIILYWPKFVSVVKITGYWPHSWILCCIFIHLNFVSVHRNEKEWGQYIPNHLDLMHSQCCIFNKHLFVEVKFGLASIFFQQKNNENREQESISKKSTKKKDKKKRGPRLSHAELWDI